MNTQHIRDYTVLRSEPKDGAPGYVVAVVINRRRGRLPVGPVKASGFGDLQWTAADGLAESIGSIEYPVEADVMQRFMSLQGLLLVEIDGEPTGEHVLMVAR